VSPEWFLPQRSKPQGSSFLCTTHDLSIDRIHLFNAPAINNCHESRSVCFKERKTEGCLGGSVGEAPTPDFGSGRDLRVLGSSPVSDSVLGGEAA